jgi:hypothetical protein
VTRRPGTPRDHGPRPDPPPGGGRPAADPAVACPFCGSRETEVFSLFGSSPLTSQHYCRGCRTVFERVKWGASPLRP